VTDDLILDAQAYQGLLERLQQRKQTSPRISVPEFKDLAGVSRKHAIPLLEHLDRQRLTRREGDERVIL